MKVEKDEAKINENSVYEASGLDPYDINPSEANDFNIICKACTFVNNRNSTICAICFDKL